MKVYLLWHHLEDGPKGMRVTTTPSKLENMVKDYDNNGWFERTSTDPVSELKSVLDSNPSDGIYPLMKGWGGLHLQIVELE